MSPDALLGFGFSKELVVLVISALPLIELRGALPVAINLFHLPWYYAFLLVIIGNLIPVPFLLLFLNTFVRFLSKIGLFKRILHWILEFHKKRGGVITRYERIGLMLFVAIPLPVTGAWTGSITAVLFGLKFKHAFLSIFAGILIAGIIITCLSLLGWIGAIIAGIGLISLVSFSLWRA